MRLQTAVSTQQVFNERPPGHNPAGPELFRQLMEIPVKTWEKIEEEFMKIIYDSSFKGMRPIQRMSLVEQAWELYTDHLQTNTPIIRECQLQDHHYVT